MSCLYSHMMWPCLSGHEFVPGVVTNSLALFWTGFCVFSLSSELASGCPRLMVRGSQSLTPKPYNYIFSHVFESSMQWGFEDL